MIGMSTIFSRAVRKTKIAPAVAPWRTFGHVLIKIAKSERDLVKSASVRFAISNSEIYRGPGSANWRHHAVSRVTGFAAANASLSQRTALPK